MRNLFLSAHASLRLLLFLTLPHRLLARVAIDPLPQQTFYNTFKTYLGRGPGGCDRSAPNGVQMMQHTLDSLGGVYAISQTVAQDLPSYPTQTYIRGLMFVFFGITFQANHQINADTENVNAYNDITSMSGEDQIFICKRSPADADLQTGLTQSIACSRIQGRTSIIRNHGTDVWRTTARTIPASPMPMGKWKRQAH